ncbi:MAG: hypothetical protein K0R57_500 [Paenibacillaceae bacterium]|nr:hypothetical protein [Paenibacillaceae bacterium]
MTKRWLYCLIAAVLTVTLFGCSQDSASSPQPGEASTGQQQQTTLKFYHWYNEETGNWKKVIAAFEAKYPDIKVESLPLVDNVNATEYLKKLDLLTASGESMDVIMFHDAGEYSKRAKVGLLEPLDPYLSKAGLKMQDEYYTDTRVDGSYYGLPAKYVLNMMLLNKTQLDAAGLPVPKDWTWEDFAEYAKKLTNGEGASKHYGAYLRDQYYHYTFMTSSLGEENYIVKGDGSSNADLPQIRQSLELRNRMENIDKTSVPLADTLSQKLNYRQQFFSGAASMLPGGTWLITEWGQFVPDFQIVWAPNPKLSKSDTSVYTQSGGDVIGVAKNSKNKEAAFTFIRWFTTEGLVEQGVALPGWKKSDLNKVLDTLVNSSKKPEAIDRESLKSTLEVSVGSKLIIPPAYGSEAEKVVTDQSQLYLLGEQDLDKTMTGIKEKIGKLAEAGKK